MASSSSGKSRPAPLRLAEESTSKPQHAEPDRIISLPSTPPTRSDRNSFTQLPPQTPALRPIAGEIEFDLDGAELLGTGLWSKVYKAEIAFPEPVHLPPSLNDLLTPPTSPQKTRGGEPSSVYAVKSSSRSDAKEVFEEEARILSYLSLDKRSLQFVIPFYGLFNSSTSLLLHCASTNLADYSRTFSDLSSVPALVDTFTSLSKQLIAGLDFIHSLRVIHADVKPANILLDFTPTGLIARYADFSASMLCPFLPDSPLLRLDPTLPDSPASSAPVSRANSQRKPPLTPGVGGGTWGFMAPEQLSANPLLNEPSYASDVYSLGIVLVVLLTAGKSPFAALEETNVFLLREAVKMGDPLRFAREGMRKRFLAIDAHPQGPKALMTVRMACRKVKNDRPTAAAWLAAIDA